MKDQEKGERTRRRNEVPGTKETTKAELVKNYISKEMQDGRLKGGQKLPSCRELAVQLHVNKITVNKVYTKLEAEHRVYSISRGGFYLIQTEDQPSNTNVSVDFRRVKPEETMIPYRQFSHVMNMAVDRYQNRIFDYEVPSGLQELRETLVTLFEKDGIYTSAENILITCGAQQAIYLAFQILHRKKGGKLLLEIPTYSLALQAAQSLEIEVTGIERKETGFDFAKLEELLKAGDITAFYVIPNHHNPTGYTLHERDKKMIAELCLRYQVTIIEDDYLADLGTKKGALPIHYYDTTKTTIYIRSFSKTFMPGIRVGAVIVHKEMLTEFEQQKRVSDLSTSRLPQAALKIFIDSGMYEKHIKKIRKSYESKLRKAREILESLSPEELRWHVPDYGIFLWLQLPQDVEAIDLKRKLEPKNILIQDATDHFLKRETGNKRGDPATYIRLCILGVSEENLSAIAVVLDTIRELQKRG